MSEPKKVDRKIPCFLFHAKEARDGKMFTTQEQVDALSADWVDTPDAFDPNYKKPEPPAGADAISEDAQARGFVKEHFPSWRFNVDPKVEPKKVGTAEEDADLDPAVWKHSPDPATWKDDAPKAPAAPKAAATPPAPLGAGAANDPPPVQPVVDADAAKAEVDARAKQAEQDATDAAALHATTVDDVVARLEKQTDRETLERVRRLEALNPGENGPRVGILKAVAKRLKDLAPADK